MSANLKNIPLKFIIEELEREKGRDREIQDYKELSSTRELAPFHPILIDQKILLHFEFSALRLELLALALCANISETLPNP